MDKATLIANLRRERSEWEALLARAGRQHMSEPGPAGDWSLRDVVAHVTIYERWTTDQLAAALRGESKAENLLYIPSEVKGMDVDQRNAVYHAQTRDLSLEDTLKAAQEVYQRLMATLEALPEEAFTETQRFTWTGGGELGEVVAGNTYEHYHEHIPAIETWLADLQDSGQE